MGSLLLEGKSFERRFLFSLFVKDRITHRTLCFCITETVHNSVSGTQWIAGSPRRSGDTLFQKNADSPGRKSAFFGWQMSDSHWMGVCTSDKTTISQNSQGHTDITQLRPCFLPRLRNAFVNMIARNENCQPNDDQLSAQRTANRIADDRLKWCRQLRRHVILWSPLG